MPRPEDTLDQLVRLARDEEALHAASERRPTANPSSDDAPADSVLPDSLTQPLTPALQLSFVDAIQARLANSERVPAPAPPRAIAPPRRGALVALVALAAAAAGVLLALRGSTDTDGPLSRYEVRLEGSEQTLRGSPQVLGLLRLQPSSRLRFGLRPQSDERGSVRVRAFVQGLAAAGPREARELEVTQEQSTAGALRVEALLPTPLPERGELLLYVGRPSTLARALPNDGPKSAPNPGSAQEFRWQFERVP
jgi:hypothetical protein